MPVKAKHIKDLPLKRVLDGSESLLVQDLNGTQQAPLGTIVDEIKQNSQEKIREIESELNQTNAQLSNFNKNIQGQIDNLVLESGSGSNLEVVQARVDNRGVIFDTLKNRMDSIEDAIMTGEFNGVSWELGTIDVDGTERDSGNRIRSDYFDIDSAINIKVSEGYKFNCYYYNNDNKFESNTGWITSELKLNVTKSKCRFILARVDENLITISERVNIDIPYKESTIVFNKLLEQEEEIAELQQQLKSINEEVYDSVFLKLGKFALGNVTQGDTILIGNNNRASICKIYIEKGKTVGFNYKLNAKYKFAIDKSQDDAINWIPSSGGAYHNDPYTITESSEYNFMVAKLDNTDITEEELIEISNSFGCGGVSRITKLEEEIENVSANISSALYGKTIVAIGDSFIDYRTQGLGNDLLSKIAEGNNMSIHNYGLSSSSLAYDTNQTVLSVMDRYEAMLNEVPNADYVMVLAGHNDSNPSLHNGTAIPIGENDDNITTTFKGALNILINALLNKYPKAGILFLTPFNRRGTELPYVKAMEEICEKYSIPCFNNYKSSGVCFQNSTHLITYDNGNLHLNGLGNEKMARKYIPILKTL